MSNTASSSSRSSSSRAVAFGSGAFEEALRQAEERLARGEGTSFVLDGASTAQCQQVLGVVAEKAQVNVHQFKMPNLLGERYVETQGHLRETFDKADEEAALLFFGEADALFAPAEYEGAPDDELTPVHYLFERVKAFGGIVMVCLCDAAHVQEAQGQGVQVVVRFDG